VVDEKDSIIGRVTSGTQSPSLKKGIGLAYIHSEYANSGNKVYIRIRGKSLKAAIVKLPFVK
jgi:aminomethyltransferase